MAPELPGRFVVEVAPSAADPLAKVSRLLAESGLAPANASGADWLSLDFGRFVHVELAQDKMDAAIARLEADAEIVSVTPEPDAEP